ncbi:MAG: hypothetical protein ACI9MR_005182 [Myxococcota bacterium]|jgi:hypothetical protein
MALVAWTGQAATASPAGALRLPMLTWGQVSYDRGNFREGVVTQVYAMQGIELGLTSWGYVGVNAALQFKDSDLDAEIWNNSFELRGGAGVRLLPPVEDVWPGAWADLWIGIRYEHLWYTTADGATAPRTAIALEGALGLDWRSESSAPSAPHQMPLLLLFDLAEAEGKREEGLLFQGRVDQLFGLIDHPLLRFGPLLGVAWKQSDRRLEHWNNLVDLRVGLRLWMDASVAQQIYGTFFFEVRMHARLYTSVDRPVTWRALAFAGWTVGGALGDRP